MSVGGFADLAGGWLDPGLADLREHRDGTGRWRTYPFHYTLSALAELEPDAALAELRYAAPACERVLRGRVRDDVFSQRRAALSERVLERV